MSTPGKIVHGRRFHGILVYLVAILLAACASSRPTEPRFFQMETHKPYAEVLAELELAITERNFRITGHNKIGSVIRERDHIDFPEYDTLQFCNLTLARQMLELSPEAVMHMPCNVTVRTQNGKVVITTHLLPTDGNDARLNEFARTMNEKLRQIVEFAAED